MGVRQVGRYPARLGKPQRHSLNDHVCLLNNRNSILIKPVNDPPYMPMEIEFRWARIAMVSGSMISCARSCMHAIACHIALLHFILCSDTTIPEKLLA